MFAFYRRLSPHHGNSSNCTWVNLAVVFSAPVCFCLAFELALLWTVFCKKHLLFGFGESMPLLGFQVFENGRKTKAV